MCHAGENTMVIVEVEQVEPAVSKRAHNIVVPVEAEILPQSRTQIYVGEQIDAEVAEAYEWDILKSIVYGGLIESITSLGVVLSAAGADAASCKCSEPRKPPFSLCLLGYTF